MLPIAKRFAGKTIRSIQKLFSNGLYAHLDSLHLQGINPDALNPVSGWVFDPQNRPIIEIEIFQGDKKIGVCNYGHTSERVYKSYPRFSQTKKCGFAGWVPIEKNPAKPISFYIHCENGERYRFARRQWPWLMRAAFIFTRNKQQKNNSSARVQKTCLPEDIPRQILVAGQAKTGTTALFFKIGNSLLACEEAISNTKFLFEPTTYSGSKNERVLAKILLHSGLVKFEDFKSFNKKILLLRDPRDQLISSLLYSAQGKTFSSSANKTNLFLTLLEKKEQSPGSVSILELRAALFDSKDSTLQEWKKNISRNLHHFLEIRRRQNDFFSYKYEDFIQGKTQELENFLGFPLTGNATVNKAFKRVVRTKKSGDWQNWFLEEDVCFFRPLFQDFMRELDYEDSWSLPECQVLLPDHGSRYVRKNLHRKSA